MSDHTSILKQLVKMSRHLGKPKRDYVILGDGNTSARTGPDTFMVKASGQTLHKIKPDGFVECYFKNVLELLEKGPLSDLQTAECLQAAKIQPDQAGRPSIECILHALALTLGKAQFVGHTHPVVWMSILCALEAESAIQGRIFTEEILYCGPAPVFVPYADPGLPLAHKALTCIRDFLNTYGEPPKVILLQNHGLFALGQTPLEVENITAMSVKAARVLLGTYLFGGPRFLADNEIARILNRPDESYRRDLACKL
jgi:rhamnose utilization protein RhaD (predicted bifunctional aldolase and dehydrogenase)